MPEFPPLPPQRPAPPLPPPAGSYEQVSTRGRRRRARYAAFAIAGLALVVAIVATSVDADRSGLRPATAPPSPKATTTRALLPASRGGVPAGFLGPEPTAEPSRSPESHRPAQVVDQPIRAKSHTMRPTYCIDNPDWRVTSGSPTDPTTMLTSTSDGTWCGGLDTPATVHSGKPAQFSYDVCRPPGAPGEKSAPTDLEVAFSIVGVWTWGHGYPFAAHPHTLHWDPGECWTWTVTWPGTDDLGNPVPPGDYVLVANPAWGGAWQEPLHVVAG